MSLAVGEATCDFAAFHVSQGAKSNRTVWVRCSHVMPFSSSKRGPRQLFWSLYLTNAP